MRIGWRRAHAGGHGEEHPKRRAEHVDRRAPVQGSEREDPRARRRQEAAAEGDAAENEARALEVCKMMDSDTIQVRVLLRS